MGQTAMGLLSLVRVLGSIPVIRQYKLIQNNLLLN